MRFSALIVASAASSAIAAPLLNNVPVLGSVLGGVLGSSDSAVPLDNYLNIVYTNVQDVPVVGSAVAGLTGNGGEESKRAAGPTVSLSLINGAGDKLLQHACADHLVDDVTGSLPIDFSQVSANGVGNFVFNGVVYPVARSVGNSPLVGCASHVGDGPVTVVRCVVPKVEGVVLNAVHDVAGVANCLADKVPVAGDVVEGAEKSLTSLPILSDLSVLDELPGVSTLTSLLNL